MARPVAPSLVATLLVGALGAACGRRSAPEGPGAPSGPSAAVSPSAGSSGARASASAPASPSPRASASTGASLDGQLQWEAPPSWRNLGVPFQSLMTAHYQAFVDMSGKVPEEAGIYIVRHGGARGPNPDARVADAVAHETDAFTRVEWKRTEPRLVHGRTVQVIEIHGIMRERSALPNGDEEILERPHRTDIAAIVPTKDAPYRVALHGREDLVDRAREDFLRFVDTLRVTGE